MRTVAWNYLSSTSVQTAEDQVFTYANVDIDKLSDHLGIKWEASKLISFEKEVSYLGFCWNLHTCVVHLPYEKKVTQLAVITEWGKKCMYNLIKMQRLYGKLLHAILVVPAGHAHLTSLEAMLTSFNNNPFHPHTPPQSTLEYLDWWQGQWLAWHLPFNSPAASPLRLSGLLRCKFWLQHCAHCWPKMSWSHAVITEHLFLFIVLSPHTLQFIVFHDPEGCMITHFTLYCANSLRLCYIYTTISINSVSVVVALDLSSFFSCESKSHYLLLLFCLAWLSKPHHKLEWTTDSLILDPQKPDHNSHQVAYVPTRM